MKPKIRRFCVVALLAAALMTTGCVSKPAQAPAPAASPAATITQTPTASLTAPPTASVTPLATLENTPRPAPSATSTPEPTPRGEYVNSDLGFSFIRPDSWKLLKEEVGFVSFEDRYSDYAFLAYSFSGYPETTIDDIAEDAARRFFNTEVHAKAEEEITLAGGIKAPGIKMTLKTYYGYIASEVVFARFGYRSYVFLSYSNPNPKETNQQTLEDFYRSIRLFLPELQGLDQEQTLAQLGNEPAPAELDPALTLEGANGYAALLYSGLVRLDASLQIVPDLASGWSISPDGKTYRFTLLPEIRFASGKVITAQDFKASWERATNPGLGSPTASIFLGGILGLEDWMSGKVGGISGITCPDERTLEVSLAWPDPNFLARLAAPAAFVVDVDQMKGENENWAASGNSSGPYIVRDYHPGEALSFERNPNYYAPPSIPNRVFLFYSNQASLFLYEENILDIARLTPANAALVRSANHSLHAELQATSELCSEILLFDNRQPPLDDINVRRALALSIDKAGLIDRLNENIDLPAGTLLPPAMPGYLAPASEAAYDPAAARAALGASSYSDQDHTITLNAPGYGDTARDDVSALVEMWRVVLGIEVQVEYLEPAAYLEETQRQHGQIVYYPYCAGYPDPESYLYHLFYSQSKLNASGYTNPEIDRLLDQARREFDPEQRMQHYQEIEARLLQDFAAIPLIHVVQDILVKPGLANFILAPIDTLQLGLEKQPQE